MYVSDASKGDCYTRLPEVHMWGIGPEDVSMKILYIQAKWAEMRRTSESCLVSRFQAIAIHRL